MRVGYTSTPPICLHGVVLSFKKAQVLLCVFSELECGMLLCIAFKFE